MRNGIRPNIRLGLELMLDGNLYKDERLGIITNHTGLDSGLNQNIDVMLEKGYTILRVFAPEHGLYGDYPDGMSVPNPYLKWWFVWERHLSKLRLIVYLHKDIAYYTIHVTCNALGLSQKDRPIFGWVGSGNIPQTIFSAQQYLWT